MTGFGNGRVRMRMVTSPLEEVIVAVPLRMDESFNTAISVINPIARGTTLCFNDSFSEWNDRFAL